MSIVDSLADHVDRLRRYAFVLCRNADGAEELVQKTLTRAIDRAHTWRAGGDLRTWLFSILHNEFVSDLRRARRRERLATQFAEVAQNHEQSPNQQPRVELRDALRALNQLPEEQRAVLVLVALEGTTYEEAAKILDVPIGTVMSRLARGRQKLAKILNEESPSQLRVVK